MRAIFYDLTELFTASSRFRYYGIARVVAEIAVELHKKQCGVRFVVYSPGHRKFFEIFPKFPENASGFSIELGIPDGARPLGLRQKYYPTNIVSKIITKLVSSAFGGVDYLRWMISGVTAEKADLSGGVLVAAGRPRIIAEYAESLKTLHPGVKFIPLLHDMIALINHVGKSSTRFSRLFQLDNSLLIRNADHIFSNSDFTRSEIFSYVEKGVLPPVPEISSVRLAHECRLGSDLPEKEIPSEPYFLCVGSTVGRKNLQVVLDAYEILTSSGSYCPRLVLAGTARARLKKHLHQEKYKKILPYIVISQNPNQTDLVRLYQSATGLIMPSRIEGWGLPAGEALWFGTPALCSDIPVLREVCGSSGLYFDPNSATELASLIMKLVSDKNLEDSIRLKISTNKESLRSWGDVAADLICHANLVE